MEMGPLNFCVRWQFWNELTFFAECLTFHEVELCFVHSTFLELGLERTLSLFLLSLCHVGVGTFNLLEYVVVEVELIGKVAIAGFIDLNTLVFKANQTQVDALEREHQQVIDQISNCRYSSFILTITLLFS